jgi:hypothetical protein
MGIACSRNGAKGCVLVGKPERTRLLEIACNRNGAKGCVLVGKPERTRLLERPKYR